MQPPSEIQAQLRSLSIPKEQRPRTQSARPRSRAGWIVGLLVILAGAAAGGVYYFRPQIASSLTSAMGEAAKADDDTGVKLVTVALTQPPDAEPVLTATGKIVSDHKVSVATKVSGQITELFFEQGDRADEGQLLATLEDILYKARRNEAAAHLQRSLAALEFQKVNFERVSTLIKANSAPSIEFADAQRAIAEAAAQVEADRATLAWAEKTLADCRVVAPIAGVILQRNVEVGDFVAAEGGRGANANAQFAVIADMTKLRVEVDISELDIVRLRQDMPCTITPDAYKDRRYPGHVMWIDPGANYSKATVQVKVRIETPDDYLRVEGSAQVSFLFESSRERKAEERAAIWIPESAVAVDSNGKAFVFIATDGRLNRAPVVIGRRSNGRVEITQGLSPGQSIASSGVSSLRDGQRVK